MENLYKKIKGQERYMFGKNMNRRLRKLTYQPAILYSKTIKSIPFTLSTKSIIDLLSTPFGKNKLIDLSITNKENEIIYSNITMIKEIQINPISRNVTHLDFVEISDDKKVQISIPITLVGKNTTLQESGGKLDLIKTKVKIECLPSDIPVSLNVDTTSYNYGIVRLDELSIPKTIKILGEENFTVFLVKRPRISKDKI